MRLVVAHPTAGRSIAGHPIAGHPTAGERVAGLPTAGERVAPSVQMPRSSFATDMTCNGKRAQ